MENQLVEGRNGEEDINGNVILISSVKRMVTWSKKVVMVAGEGIITGGGASGSKEKMKTRYSA